MARRKKATVALRSLADCEATMGELMLAALRLENAETALAAAMAAAREKYAAEIEEATGLRAELELQLREYYMAHLGEVEADGARSVRLTHGVMGRRLSPPAVKLLNKSWTWAAVLSRLIEYGFKHLVRWRDPEIDKQAILRADLDAEKLRGLGLRIEQEELFYAEPERQAGA